MFTAVCASTILTSPYSPCKSLSMMMSLKLLPLPHLVDHIYDILDTFFIYDNTDFIEYAGIPCVTALGPGGFFVLFFYTFYLPSWCLWHHHILADKEGPSQPLTKTDCYNRAFIFHPIIGESIRECERSTHKRTVSCFVGSGKRLFVSACLSVCPSVCE